MFAFLIIASLAAAVPTGSGSVVFPPKGDAPSRYRCDPRPCPKPMPKPGPVYEGSFIAMRESQIQCRQAPCPQAGVIVTLPSRPPIRVSRLTYARTTADALKLDFDPDRRTILFDGKLWITSGGTSTSERVALVAPVSARYAAPPRRPSSRPKR